MAFVAIDIFRCAYVELGKGLKFKLRELDPSAVTDSLLPIPRSSRLMGRVLIAGGIGGLGHTGIQFAKKFGYRVAALGWGSGNAALAKKRTQSTVAPRSSARIPCGSTGTRVVPSGVTAFPG